MEFTDIKKFVGVGSISILGINPNNSQLRLYGWQIPEDADEPVYTTVDSEGKKSARVRFLVQIQDLPEKPVVAMDFWVRPDVMLTNPSPDSGKVVKCVIIDSYGRTAYATKSEVQARKIPQYANGPANISQDYKPCHVGQEPIVSFLMKFLNVTPLRSFSRNTNSWVINKNPGRLTIDDWGKLCDGDVSELKADVALQPDNRVKVVFGIRTTEDNKTYQTFLPTAFIGNGAPVNKTTGEYDSARKAIDKFNERDHRDSFVFSAAPVREWKQEADDVNDNSANNEIPGFDDSVDDLPFE